MYFCQKFKMKKLLVITFTCLVAFTFAQKKEKIKGSKIVTIEKKQIEAFESIEILDNFEVSLVKGELCGLEIEADDNLHEVIDLAMNGTMLRIGSTKTISGYKKLSLRIIYTDAFKEIIARNDAKIATVSTMELPKINIRAYDDAKLLLNAKTDEFALALDDKAEIEMNVKAKKSTINLLKNAEAKAVLVGDTATLDLYQKSEAKVEGDCNNLVLRLDNSASFSGKNLTVKNTELTIEESCNAEVNVKDNLKLDASGKSEVQLYNDPKIEIIRFSDNAVLRKKSSK